MKHTAIVLLSMLVAFGALAERGPGSITGVVLHEDVPLPGTTIRLLAHGTEIGTTTTDDDGRYLIGDVPGGYYEVEASLEGMTSAIEEVYVDGTAAVAPPMSLAVAVTTEAIVFTCGSPCGGEGEPSCEDYEFNRELEAKSLDDGVALQRLEQRYRATASREERARIAGFLVSVLDDDDEFIRSLIESAEILIFLGERSEGNLGEDDPHYISWCNVAGRDPLDELWLLHSETRALLGSMDSRAIAYAHRALRTRDIALKSYAFDLASLTCDASLLKAIGDDLERGVEQYDLYPFVQVMPCGDRGLNERIIAIDPEYVEELLPGILESRAAELARLRPPAP